MHLCCCYHWEVGKELENCYLQVQEHVLSINHQPPEPELQLYLSTKLLGTFYMVAIMYFDFDCYSLVT